MRSRNAAKYLFAVFRLTPAICAICKASRSTANSLTICRILASEIFERIAYLFFIGIPSFEANHEWLS